MGSSQRQRGRGRAYRPKLEALEALRLLDAAAPHLLPLSFEQAPLPGENLPDLGPNSDAGSGPLTLVPVAAPFDAAAWDLALDQESADFAEWLEAPAAGLDAERAGIAGLAQLNRYLACAWARAGIKPQQHDDCTQAVHAAMLQKVGRAEFDGLLADIGRQGVPRVLNRETPHGPDFFRAVDRIKKQAQRQRGFLALDEQAEFAAPAGGDDAETWRGALHEAIERTLDAREAALIRDTLDGFGPAEIAQRWGLAPKTISNEKTRVLKKLRDYLVAEIEAGA